MHLRVSTNYLHFLRTNGWCRLTRQGNYHQRNGGDSCPVSVSLRHNFINFSCHLKHQEQFLSSVIHITPYLFSESLSFFGSVRIFAMGCFTSHGAWCFSQPMNIIQPDSSHWMFTVRFVLWFDDYLLENPRNELIVWTCQFVVFFHRVVEYP